MPGRLSDEKRAELWALADHNGWTQTEVQRRLGLNRGTISGILKRGAKYGLSAAKLDDWLQTFAHTPAFDVAEAPKVATLDVPELVAEKLIWLAGVLVSEDINPDEKVEEFVRLINRFHGSLKTYTTEMKVAWERRK